jgi:HNH endonuclease
MSQVKSTKITLTCPECKNSFLTYPSRIKFSKAKLEDICCSRKCAALYKIKTFAHKDPEDCFWEKVTKTDYCWIWNGATDSSGYGSINVRCKIMGAHRFSWMIHIGHIPKGLILLHSCDNTRCVNPKHLSLGTDKNNKDDSVRKRRHHHGEHHSWAKLTEKQVLSIRLKHENGVSAPILASHRDVDESTIRAIIRRRTWKHI